MAIFHMTTKADWKNFEDDDHYALSGDSTWMRWIIYYDNEWSLW